MTYYQKHVFFCLNQRTPDKKCCFNSGSQDLFEYAKKQIKLKNLNAENNIRINKAGCLGRCEEGPVVVIYPEGVWYHCETFADIDEIIESHLISGKIVEKLRI